jgi:hypothetical protein
MVNGVNPIRRFWNLLCKLDRDMANFIPYHLTDENPSANIRWNFHVSRIYGLTEFKRASVVVIKVVTGLGSCGT